MLAEGRQYSRGVAVSIREVSVALGGRSVLENFNVEIAAGEFVAIVGRSGCGKKHFVAVNRGS